VKPQGAAKADIRNEVRDPDNLTYIGGKILIERRRDLGMKNQKEHTEKQYMECREKPLEILPVCAIERKWHYSPSTKVTLDCQRFVAASLRVALHLLAVRDPWLIHARGTNRC